MPRAVIVLSRRPSRSTILVALSHRIGNKNSPANTQLSLRNMSKIAAVTTHNAPAALSVYSQAIVANGFVYCSGQLPADATGAIIEGDIKAHTKQCFKNLSAVLEKAGSSLKSIVKVNIFLADMSDFAAMNEAYEQILGDPKPARSCVAVKTLPKNVDIEIECIGVVE